MKNIYVVKLGNLYLKQRGAGMFGIRRYELTNNLDDAIISEDFGSAEKIAEEIGGKAYKIRLEEVEDEGVTRIEYYKDGWED